MISVGIDIGSTSVCGVALEAESGSLIRTVELKNDSSLSGESFESLFDPERIVDLCYAIYKDLAAQTGAIGALGITGQQHGIVYVGKDGRAVSPFINWQDKRGDLKHSSDKFSYAEKLSAAYHTRLSSGYGAVTHFYNAQNGLIPEGAVYFCSIMDYVTLRMTEAKRPPVHPSNAASFGLYDSTKRRFFAGTDCYYPEIADDFQRVGKTLDGVPVCAAIGDNQASVLASLRDPDKQLLVNVGTGSQFSAVSQRNLPLPEGSALERRPFFGEEALLVGASLCGGKAYATLESFFRDTLRLFTGRESGELYDKMTAALEKPAALEPPAAPPLSICPLFSGSRTDPTACGSITGITTGNFTPEALIRGVLDGIAGELYGFASEAKTLLPEHAFSLVGSGNGLRKNPALRRIMSERFGMPLVTPLYKEEAAYGAAMTALVATGFFGGISEARSMIKYTDE